eukprot:CAMPEP_0113451208 /NCGR_PEP_ID=MMETSP0014_2-20120614/6221_1 /TAXON_ID=2857 /ORGANISM="Nitzschia sp." /LENGTH=155 /DNA_ID=CAMNT_0000342559 /DNA_START=151 /DNA_END=618 /DNA_ORIENTATION=+ /assembly_acc=CAM_ASM_000159
MASSMSSSAKGSSNVPKPKVGFDEVEILEFNYVLGDNPGVSSGAPIALGADLQNQITLEVDYYEKARGKRKSRKKMTIPVHERAHILMSQGYSLEDIASATMEADAISRDRANSANAKNWDKVNEVSERFSRIFTKALKTKKPTPLKSQSAGQAA